MWRKNCAQLDKMFQSIQWWTRLWSVECTLASFSLHFSRSLCMNLIYLSLALSVEKKIAVYFACCFSNIFLLYAGPTRVVKVLIQTLRIRDSSTYDTHGDSKRERKNLLFTAKARTCKYVWIAGVCCEAIESSLTNENRIGMW